MSTRLLLQPAIISYGMLAFTLWFLRPGERALGKRLPPFFPPWPLLVLFALWANLDSRFVLGLGTVALVWLGEVLDEGVAGGGRRLCLVRRLFSMAFLGAVCLLNPSHVKVFSLPPEVGWFDPAGPAAAALAWRKVASPFQGAYLTKFGLSPAGLAFFLLLGLGLLSFLLNLSRWNWKRFLPWLGLALVSAFQVRAVAFFAVAAGPVLAWNLQEFLEERLAQKRQPGQLGRRSLLGLRPLAVVVGLAFLVCAWPGWLQAPPFEPRRWAVEIPPSLERGAAQTRRWHQEGKLGPEARGLHLLPQTAHAFAWFCPEEKGLLEDQLAGAIVAAPAAAEDRDQRMRLAGINHVILYDPDGGRLFSGLERLLADPEQWPLLYLEGDLAVFGWRDPARARAKDLFRGWELDLNRLAFHPAQDKKAPPRRPDREPEPRPWWEVFFQPALGRSIDRDEATLHLFHAETLRRSAPRRNLAAWEASQSVGLVGAAGGGTGPGGLLETNLRLVLLRTLLPKQDSGFGTLPALDRLALGGLHMFTLPRDDTPPALLYLAVRAARRALAANPQDSRACLILGESYLRLLHNTRERAWGARLKQLVQLRQTQASVALNQALSLKPDLAQAHLNLGWLYHEMGYLDLAWQHLRIHRQLSQDAGPPPGLSAEQFHQQESQQEKELSRLAEEVKEQEKKYLVEAAGLMVPDLALLAARKGLAGKARDLLLESDIAMFGPRGMALELELLLRTGRVKEVREWAGPEHKTALGAVSFHWLRAQALAASSDYALAKAELAQLASGAWGQEPRELQKAMALVIGQAVLDQQPGVRSLPHLLWQVLRQAEFRNRVAAFTRSLRQAANATVLRGLLALEEGEVNDAAAAFRLALSFWQDETGDGLEFAGRSIAQGCLGWLK